MKYEVDFTHPKSDQIRTISVQLTADDIERAAGSDLFLKAFAVRHAYGKAPAGYFHVAHGQRLVALH